MYLDDLVVVAPSSQEARQLFHTTQRLLKELGLPEAVDKTQPPSQIITWLGITVNTQQMTISMPKEMVEHTLKVIQTAAARRSINKRSLQSILGKILHVSKCVSPARPFVARLLDALRSASCAHIRMTMDMKKDLAWFTEFLPAWNGVAFINSGRASREIVADACPKGFARQMVNGDTQYQPRGSCRDGTSQHWRRPTSCWRWPCLPVHTTAGESSGLDATIVQQWTPSQQGAVMTHSSWTAPGACGS